MNQPPVFPTVSVLGFDPTDLSTDLTEIINKLQAIIDDSSTIKTTTEAILADMVGETTFLASIAELNLAIGALGEDIDLAIIALGVSIAASLAAQTGALIANNNSNFGSVVSSLTSLYNLLTSVYNILVPMSANLYAIVGQNDVITTRLEAILEVVSVIDARVATANTKLTAIQSLLVTISETTTQILNQSIDTNMILDNTYSLLDLRLLQFQVHLDNFEVKFSETNAKLQSIYDLLDLRTATMNDYLAKIAFALSPPGISEPYYTLVYQLWQALAYGGYYSAGTSPPALRVEVTS